MAVDGLAEKLSLLLYQGSLPASRLTTRDRLRLSTLFDTGAVTEERSGAGRRLVVKSHEALTAYIAQNYPSGLEGSRGNFAPRSRAVADLRDSKKAHESGPPTVLLRGFGNCQLYAKDQVLPIAHWTQLAGVAALCLKEDWHWGFRGILAVVENAEVFWNFEKLCTGAQLALYAQGRLSGRVLAWLASPEMVQARILHCGDYDPVGLDEYLRLKAACPERADLYLPPDLEDLLARYGKRELLIDNVAVLDRLRKTDDPLVRQVVLMMDRWGVGLEQEALLLRIASG
ncbi:MAG: hypothetical protein P8Y63_11515 [Deltaproteobacteria bacterium]